IDLLGCAALLLTLFAAWRAVPAERTRALLWIQFITVASLIFAMLSVVLWLLHGPGYWAQRYYITVSCIWVASIPFVLRASLLQRVLTLKTRRAVVKA